jgi:multiple sugar transport system permease protein
MRFPNQIRQLGARIGHYFILVFFVVFAAFPFYWMFVTTFKQTGDLYNLQNNPYIFNKWPTMEHLELLFHQTDYVRWLLNTFFVGLIVVVITLVVAVPAGYCLARLVGRWGERLGIGIFLTYLIPPTLLFIPLSRVVANLGLQDSLWSLVVVYPSFTIPFCTWLLMGFFKSIPPDIEEAAMIDGCSRLGALTRVVMPVSMAGIFTSMTFAFTLCVQEFVYSLTFISTSSHMTVSVGVPTNLVRGDVYYWGPLMAAALITSVPIAFVYNLFLDKFIAGFTVGAIR